MVITNKKSVVIALDEPTPIAFLNLYEEGDEWVKIKGCDECTLENRIKCCNNCPMFLKEKGGICSWNLERPPTGKPFYCIVNPVPNICKKTCILEYECTKGTNKGKIRRVQDTRDVLR